MTKATVRKAVFEASIAFLIALLPFQIGFAQTITSNDTLVTEAVSAVSPLYDSNTSFSDWQHEWRQQLRDWWKDWRQHFGKKTYTKSNGSRSVAARAIDRAEAEVNDFRHYLEDWDSNTTNGDRELKRAERVLHSAEKQLSKARTEFEKGRYNNAVKSARKAREMISRYRGDNTNFEVPVDCTLSQSRLRSITNYPPPEGPIVALGDSLTAGVGSSGGHDYVSELEDRLAEPIINAGVSGDTTEEALARLDEDVLSHHPRAVIVFLGANDVLARSYDAIAHRAENSSFWRRVLQAVNRLFNNRPRNDEVLTEDETFENLRTIVEEIEDTGAVVILVGIDGEPLDKSLNRRYQEVATDTGALYVKDVLRGILGRPNLTSSDFIHPNNAGYALIADRIYPAAACLKEA